MFCVIDTSLDKFNVMASSALLVNETESKTIDDVRRLVKWKIFSAEISGGNEAIEISKENGLLIITIFRPSLSAVYK